MLAIGARRLVARSRPLHAFLCKGYLYSLHHILSGPSIFSRIFSNIENILTSRRSTETKSRSKPAQNLQNLKISVGIDPKPTVEGGIAVSSSLVKTVLDAAQRQRQEIQEYLWTRGLLRSRAAESSYILEGKAGRGIYVLENILEYESARDLLYSQRYSRITRTGQITHTSLAREGASNRHLTRTHTRARPCPASRRVC